MTLSESSPNEKIKLFLPNREFILDCQSRVQPVDGGLVVETNYLRLPGHTVFVELTAVVRYGREEDEMVLGICMANEICLASFTLTEDHPPTQPQTLMQEELKKIHGDSFFPFHLEWPKGIGASLYVTQPTTYTGKSCGIEYLVEVFCLKKGKTDPQKGSHIRFEIEIIQLLGAAEKSALWIPPAVSISQRLHFSSGRVNMEVNLEKVSISNGDPVVAHISIMNRSNRSIKEIKVALVQLFKLSISNGFSRVRIHTIKSTNGFPIAPGGTLNMTVMLLARVPPIATKDEKMVAAAVHGCIDSKNVILASSTLASQQGEKIIGFDVAYRVCVKLTVTRTPFKSAVVVAQIPLYVFRKKSISTTGWMDQAIQQKELDNEDQRTSCRHRTRYLNLKEDSF